MSSSRAVPGSQQISHSKEEAVAMQTLTIVTYDWVPGIARGFVRDIRVRWAAEEAGLAYRIETVPVRQKSELHRAMQPFEQVPILKDGDISLFESGAILWHLGEGSDALMPRDARGRAATVQWLFAALNSVEPMTIAWLLAKMFDRDEAQTERAASRMNPRLGQLAAVLQGREFLAAGRFTVADIMMSDVLRIVKAQGGLAGFPALSAYVERLTARPAFRKAHDGQMAHWAAADVREQAAG
jgi:glutathione S-transferase